MDGLMLGLLAFIVVLIIYYAGRSSVSKFEEQVKTLDDSIAELSETYQNATSDDSIERVQSETTKIVQSSSPSSIEPAERAATVAQLAVESVAKTSAAIKDGNLKVAAQAAELTKDSAKAAVEAASVAVSVAKTTDSESDKQAAIKAVESAKLAVEASKVAVEISKTPDEKMQMYVKEARELQAEFQSMEKDLKSFIPIITKKFSSYGVKKLPPYMQSVKTAIGKYKTQDAKMKFGQAFSDIERGMTSNRLELVKQGIVRLKAGVNIIASTLAVMSAAASKIGVTLRDPSLAKAGAAVAKKVAALPNVSPKAKAIAQKSADVGEKRAIQIPTLEGEERSFGKSQTVATPTAGAADTKGIYNQPEHPFPQTGSRDETANKTAMSKAFAIGVKEKDISLPDVTPNELSRSIMQSSATGSVMPVLDRTRRPAPQDIMRSTQDGQQQLGVGVRPAPFETIELHFTRTRPVSTPYGCSDAVTTKAAHLTKHVEYTPLKPLGMGPGATDGFIAKKEGSPEFDGLAISPSNGISIEPQYIPSHQQAWSFSRPFFNDPFAQPFPGDSQQPVYPEAVVMNPRLRHRKEMMRPRDGIVFKLFG